MRILTWNINGVRTVPQYHPWNTLSTFEDILNMLEADIICFQEVKTSRASLSKAVAVPSSYNAFFSFPVRKSGYSGVATYTRTASVVPVKAEEGLCGIIQPKPPLSSDERVSRWEAYPQRIIEQDDEGRPDESACDLDYKDLDSEGRALVIDFGLFVLINVYCPNDGIGTEERDKYKSDFHRVLEARVKGLIEKERREVIVVGDLNACAAVIDHCEGHLMIAQGKAEGLEGEDGFWAKDVRRWLRDWLVNEDGTGGCMVDIVRRLWPDRRGMYTCWNTKISARDSNYGTRIDYILVTRGLLPWVKGADIQPQIKGSDHCPVYLDLNESITNSDGSIVHLRDVLGLKQDGDTPPEPPRLAAKFWDEYSGKQMLLEKFFGRTGNMAPIDNTKLSSTEPDQTGEKYQEAVSNAAIPLPSDRQDTTVAECSSDAFIDLTCSDASPFSSLLPTQPPTPIRGPSDSDEASASTGSKRKLTTESLTRGSSSKKQKQKEQERKPGQTKLSTFFAKPKVSSSSSPRASSSREHSVSRKGRTTENPVNEESSIAEMDVESDYQLALLLSSQESEPLKPPATDPMAKQVWSTLLAPLRPPKCSVHGEPTKEFTVNKVGPNKGKRFFICARPVGPGYDKGRTERLREHVDPQWRCNFFKWSSDVRREVRKGDS